MVKMGLDEISCNAVTH